MPSPFPGLCAPSRPRRPAALCLALMACFSAAHASNHTPPSSPTPQAQAVGHPGAASVAAPPPKTAVPLANAWTQANDTVGQFLRGHIDLLRWEANNPDRTHTPATPQSQAQDTLSLTQALELSWRGQPQWLQRPNMSGAEQYALNTERQTHVLRMQRAWLEAVSAHQAVAHSRLNLQAAQAGAELAERMAHVGNWSRARQMQEELLLWEARSQLQNAELKALQTHLALWQFVGQADAVELPALPDLPNLPDANLPSVDALTAQALAANLKWASIKTDAERLLKGQTASSLAQARQAMQPDPAKAPGDSMTPDAFTPLPPALLPANVPWSHSTENALQAQAHADALQRQIRADVRLAHAAYLHAHTQATQNRPHVLRLHTALEQESLLRYNGMLKSTWDLLASARQRIQSKQALHQAQTQAWLAWADLQAVLNGLPYTGQLNLDAGQATSQPSAGH